MDIKREELVQACSHVLKDRDQLLHENSKWHEIRTEEIEICLIPMPLSSV